MTAKEEKFCLDVSSGMTLSDAYRDAYNAENMKDKTINNRAYELSLKGEIKGRIEQLREEAKNDRIMSTIQKKELLTQWILEAESSKADRLKALDILNKMDGEYITRIEGKMNVSYEESLKEVADSDEY